MTGGCHCARPGVACGAVSNGITLDSVLMYCKEEADEYDSNTRGLIGNGRWGWMVFDEEFYIL